MNNRFNIHKDIGDIINNYEEQTVTPYISISDSSNMQVESSHFSINNKNSTSLINNNLQNNQNHNNNNLIFSNSGFFSLSKSIINNNINVSHNNNSGVQISAESLSGSNKLQMSSNSTVLKKNDISKNSIFLSPSTLCNYYQQSNDVTPYKSPLTKNNEQSSGKEKDKEKIKLKQINIDLDIIHKKKNSVNNINNNINNNISSNKNNNIINNNNVEITSRSDECEPSQENNKTLSSQRKYVFDKKTPIKYAKNQLQSGEKIKSSKSNNSKLEKEKEIKKKTLVIQNKNGRNLMDTFEKVGNDKDNDDNLKFFNNKREPTEIYEPSGDNKINQNNNDNNNNLGTKFIDRFDDDSSFMEKDNSNKSNNNKSNNADLEEFNITDKLRNSIKNEEKNNMSYNTIKNEKIEIKKDNLNLNLNKEINKERKEPNINIQFKKISMKKIIPNKKIENNNITEIPKNIIKELSRVDSIKKKESKGKRRPTSFTKNIIINFNSFNSIGVNNNNNIDNNIFKTKKNRNLLIKKAIKNINDLLDKKISLSTKNKQGNNKSSNNTIEPNIIRRKIKIPNRIKKKEKIKEISINGITNNKEKEKKRQPSSENYNRRENSFSGLKQHVNTNLFHNNLINKNINKKIIRESSSGQRNNSKNQNKKQSPLIVNLFIEEDKHNLNNNNIIHHLPNKENSINKKNSMNKKKVKPLLNKKDISTIFSNSLNHIINTNNNDRNYQTISFGRHGLDIKIPKINEKKDYKENDNIIKKKENKITKALFNNININNNNEINNNMNNKNMNINIKKKEENKVKIIQNFSSYHKIKYKSHIAEKINFAETQTKQNNLFNDVFYNKNKKENKKTKSGTNFLIYNNNDSKNNTINANNSSLTRQIKFRKLEKLPGDSDSGDVVLNEQ